ncbi:MAG: immunoglobulin domain-containing protein [Sedimentisphaerales bacterium]|nr:immunoglobulin domain-containing protein [Sedimentisphaerales bacterium]
MKTIGMLCALLLIVWSAGIGYVETAQGGIPITIVNPSFEDPCLADLNIAKIKGFDGVVTGYPDDVPGWNDDCPSGEFNHSGIKRQEAEGSSVTGQRVRTGEQGAHLSPDLGTLNETIVWQLTDKTIVTNEMYKLNIWGWADGLAGLDEVTLVVSLFYDDGGTHIEVASQEHFLPYDNNDPYPPAQACGVEFTVNDVPASAGNKLGIKFENITTGFTGGGFAHLDDVTLEQVLVHSPSPADEESDVAVERNIEWNLASVVTNCDVYFGSDPNFINNPMVVDGQTQGKVESYNPPGNMDNDTTYYWRVDARVNTTVYEGDIWEFTTEPIITEDPCGLTVDAGDTAVFRVKATYGSTYLWRKLDSPNPPDNTGSTLTIPNVQKANEGTYFCTVTNSASVPVIAYSAWVNLMTKRMVARWEFDESLYAEDDEGAPCWLGDYTDPNLANDQPDPVYVLDPCSIDGGKALQLAADVFHVRITDSEDFFNFYPQGYTVNAWVKTEQEADYGCMASKQHRGDNHPTDSEGWVLNCTDTGTAAHGLRQVFGGSVVGTSNIADNQWRMVTTTYNAETGTGTVYVDGLLESQLADTVSKAPTNTYPVVLGAETVLAELSAYEGLLDKTSIYSYALDQVEVAMLYIGVMGGDLCVGGNPEGDLNDDCKVDAQDFVELTNDWLDGQVNLLDFAVLSTGWLECNLVPQTECP